MRRTVIARGGDCGRALSIHREYPDKVTGIGGSTVECSSAIALTSMGAFAVLGWVAAFQVFAVGTSF